MVTTRAKNRETLARVVEPLRFTDTPVTVAHNAKNPNRSTTTTPSTAVAILCNDVTALTCDNSALRKSHTERTSTALLLAMISTLSSLLLQSASCWWPWPKNWPLRSRHVSAQSKSCGTKSFRYATRHGATHIFGVAMLKFDVDVRCTQEICKAVAWSSAQECTQLYGAIPPLRYPRTFLVVRASCTN